MESVAKRSPIPADDDDVLLDTEAAAAFLGLAPATLDIWRCTGRYNLAFVRIGRSIKYTKRHLKQFIARRTVGEQ
jgi:hypothetical protein